MSLNPQILRRPGNRFPLVVTKDYTVEGELKDTGELFLHLAPLTKWSKTVCHHLLETMVNIKVAAEGRGIKHLYTLIPDEKKVVHFNLMMGFEPIERYGEYILMWQRV
jgi:hypothetical protein